jgi:hypothetical protein
VSVSGASVVAKFPGWASGRYAGAITGGGGWLGRQTLGRMGHGWSQNEGLRNAAASGGAKGIAARMLLNRTNRMAEGSYDARGSRLGGAVLQGAGIRAGQAGGQGGRRADVEALARRREQFANRLQESEGAKAARARSPEAQALLDKEREALGRAKLEQEKMRKLTAEHAKETDDAKRKKLDEERRAIQNSLNSYRADADEAHKQREMYINNTAAERERLETYTQTLEQGQREGTLIAGGRLRGKLPITPMSQGELAQLGQTSGGEDGTQQPLQLEDKREIPFNVGDLSRNLNLVNVQNPTAPYTTPARLEREPLHEDIGTRRPAIQLDTANMNAQNVTLQAQRMSEERVRTATPAPKIPELNNLRDLIEYTAGAIRGIESRNKMQEVTPALQRSLELLTRQNTKLLEYAQKNPVTTGIDGNTQLHMDFAAARTNLQSVLTEVYKEGINVQRAPLHEVATAAAAQATAASPARVQQPSIPPPQSGGSGIGNLTVENRASHPSSSNYQQNVQHVQDLQTRTRIRQAIPKNSEGDSGTTPQPPKPPTTS